MVVAADNSVPKVVSCYFRLGAPRSDSFAPLACFPIVEGLSWCHIVDGGKLSVSIIQHIVKGAKFCPTFVSDPEKCHRC